MKNIKTKIDSVSNMKQIFHSMESADSDKLKKIKGQISVYKSFMEDFLSIVGSVNSSLFNNRHVSDSQKKLILVFSTDKGFCGNYNNKIFKNIYSEYCDCIDDVDVFCIGKKAFEFFAKKGFNVVGYLKLSDDFSLDDLSEVYEYFLSSISNNVYCDISVYLNSLKNKTITNFANYNLYPVDQSSFELFMGDLGMNISKYSSCDNVNFSGESESFQLEIEKQLLQYMLYGAALQNKMAELSSRISVLQNIKNTSDYVVRDLRLSFNRICQSLLSREVMNIMDVKTVC